MVFGPRLDRPTAVGDEGRPRATSLGIVAVVVVGIVVLTGAALDEPGYFGGFAVFVGLAVAGMALLDRESLGPTVVGHLLFLPAALVVVALVVFSAGDPLLVGGAILAMAGIASGWADVTDEQVGNALASNVVAYGFAMVGLVALGTVAGVLLVFWDALFDLSSGASPTARVVGLAVLATVVGACLLVAIRVVPAIQLAPRHRRDLTRRRVDRAFEIVLRVTLAWFGVFVCTVILALAGVTGSVAGAAPVWVLLDVLTTPFVTVPALGIGVAALIVAGSTYVIRTAASASDARTTRVTGATLAALGYVVAFGLFVLTTRLVFVGGTLGLLVVFGAVLLPLVVYLVLGSTYLCMRTGLVPDRAGPPALAAGGLVLMGVGAATADLPAVLVFAAVAGGLVAWDVGTYGLGVTAELGHVPGTRRLELYHGVFAVGVGLVAVAGATALEAASRTVATGVGTPEAVGLAVLGVVLLLVPLRG